MLLLNFVRLGEEASLLIGDALRLVEMNQTQAMICWRLHECGSAGVTLTELSLQLGVNATRLQNHIPVLISRKLIQLVQRPAETDRRMKFYRLTPFGTQKTLLFLTAVKEIDAHIGDVLLPRRIKDQERWRLIRDQFVEAHLQISRVRE